MAMKKWIALLLIALLLLGNVAYAETIMIPKLTAILPTNSSIGPEWWGGYGLADSNTEYIIDGKTVMYYDEDSIHYDTLSCVISDESIVSADAFWEKNTNTSEEGIRGICFASCYYSINSKDQEGVAYVTFHRVSNDDEFIKQCEIHVVEEPDWLEIYPSTNSALIKLIEGDHGLGLAGNLLYGLFTGAIPLSRIGGIIAGTIGSGADASLAELKTVNWEPEFTVLSVEIRNPNTYPVTAQLDLSANRMRLSELKVAANNYPTIVHQPVSEENSITKTFDLSGMSSITYDFFVYPEIVYGTPVEVDGEIVYDTTRYEDTVTVECRYNNPLNRDEDLVTSDTMTYTVHSYLKSKEEYSKNYYQFFRDLHIQVPENLINDFHQWQEDMMNKLRSLLPAE